MTQFIQYVIDGLATGSVYAAVALSLVLIYRVMRHVNFAQGEMAMLSTYVAWMFTQAGWPIWGAIIASMVLSFGFGAAIEFFLIRRVPESAPLGVVILTLGLFLAFNALAVVIWGTTVKVLPNPFPSQILRVGDLTISSSAIGTVSLLLVTVILLNLLFRRTRFGLAMRSVASNAESARLVGVRVDRILMAGWGLAASIGALAGTLIAPRLFIQPSFMFIVLIYAFAAATLGGFESPAGAIVGGLLVGVIEQFAGVLIGQDLKIGVAFGVLVLFLLLRPQGLFGRASVVRA